MFIVLQSDAVIFEEDWIVGNPLFPRTFFGAAIGFWNNSIFILGGSGVKKQFVEYNIVNSNIIDYGTNYLSGDIRGYGQLCCQQHNYLYMITANGDALCMLDLSTTTKELQCNWNSLTIPYDVGYYGCLAANDEYLFIIGGDDSKGRLKYLQILQLSLLEWLSNPPSLNTARRSAACIIHETAGFLYTAGGYPFNSGIEKIGIANILSNTWQITSELVYNADGARAILYESDYILIIGGWRAFNPHTPNEYIQIIDTKTDTVSLSSSTLNFPVSSTSVIIVENTIYKFGGSTDSNTKTNQWETYHISTDSTTNPSHAPTNHPITTAPSSTQPGTIMCGVPSVGVYSNAGDQLIFEVSMAFIGELIFDASGSNFAIAGIEVFTGLDAFLGWDSDKDGIVSLNPAAVGDYKFILVGEATGIYYVQIGCVSDEPTVFPTQTPTKYPSTAHHTSTHGPSTKPSDSPVTSDPTTAIRTVLPTHRPSHRPTPLVTTERPIVADTTEDEDPLKGNQSQGENGVRSAAFVVSGFVICCLCVCVGIVFHKYFWDDVKKMIETQHEMMISHPTNAPMAANSEDWRRPQAEIAFERDLVVQWLIHSVQLPQYTSGFLSQGYDNMRAIKAINTKEELAHCGIESPEHQTLILAEIYKVRNAAVPNEVLQKEKVVRIENDAPHNNMDDEHSDTEAMFDTNYVHAIAIVSCGNDEVPLAADVPLMIDPPFENAPGAPSPPPMNKLDVVIDPEDAMTMEGSK